MVVLASLIFNGIRMMFQDFYVYSRNTTRNTKHIILSKIVQLFDPLGLMAQSLLYSQYKWQFK